MRSSPVAASPVLDQEGRAELALVAELGAALVAPSDLTGLRVVLQRHLKWLLPAAHVSLCLLVEDGRAYRVLAGDGLERHYRLSEGLIDWALRHRTPLNIPDLEDEAHLPPGVSRVAWRWGRGALLVLPLVADNHPLGALTLGSPRIGAYTAVDRGLLHLITLQVAAAVRTALLLAELDGAEAVIAGMARAVDAKDSYTHGHAGRVTAYAIALVEAAGLPTAVRDLVAGAGPLHDIGKIGIPDAVLRKPGRLTEEEFALIRRHPTLGEEICRPLRSLRRLRAAIRHHHERWDGQGYPDGLVGAAIPMEARVLAIADAFDAMTSNRSYRAALPVQEALDILTADAGSQWDPALTTVFCKLQRGLRIL